MLRIAILALSGEWTKGQTLFSPRVKLMSLSHWLLDQASLDDVSMSNHIPLKKNKLGEAFPPCFPSQLVRNLANLLLERRSYETSVNGYG